MTSQPGQQTITIHILPNISRSKDNQVMKLRQVIEDNKKTFLNMMQKMSQGNQFQTTFFKKKSLYELKASGLEFSFNIFLQP